MRTSFAQRILQSSRSDPINHQPLMELPPRSAASYGVSGRTAIGDPHFSAYAPPA